MKPDHEMTAEQRLLLSHIKTARQSDMALARYAKVNNLSTNALYYWNRKFMAAGLLEGCSSSAFVKVSTPSSVVDRAGRTVTVEFPNQIRLELPASGLDVSQLVKLVNGL